MGKLDVPLVALMAFSFSFLLHSPYVYPNIYSDIISVYYRPEVMAKRVPYVEYVFEYPALIGILIYFSATLPPSLTIYTIRMFIALVVTAIFSAFLLERLLKKDNALGEERIFTYFLLAPSFLIYGYYNWDMLSVVFTLAALYFFRAGKLYACMASLGIGITGKIYSGVLLPAFLFELKSWALRFKCIAVAVISWFSINAPFIFANPGGWLETYVFLSRWGIENSWLRFIFGQFSMEAKYLGALIFAWLLLRITLRQDRALESKCFMVALSWVITSYISTPQMALWLLPFYALLKASKIKFYLAEVLNALIILTWFTQSDPLSPTSATQMINLGRQAVWLTMLLDEWGFKLPGKFQLRWFMGRV